ncbi:MarR family transcriptional regulator [Bifidobacterium bifidum]|nr:MarR family transcriptional regulator [Bifidobacterium bifidum]
MFLDRNRNREIYQHTIEQKFCITRSTASRVLALMEKKGLIARESVAHDARCKRIVLTDKADAIVADLKAVDIRKAPNQPLETDIPMVLFDDYT